MHAAAARLIPVECDEAHRKAFYGGGLGLKADVPVAKSGASQTFVNPPDLADMEQETPSCPSVRKTSSAA